jgi:hypothetical protein
MMLKTMRRFMLKRLAPMLLIAAGTTLGINGVPANAALDGIDISRSGTTVTVEVDCSKNYGDPYPVVEVYPGDTLSLESLIATGEPGGCTTLYVSPGALTAYFEDTTPPSGGTAALGTGLTYQVKSSAPLGDLGNDFVLFGPGETVDLGQHFNIRIVEAPITDGIVFSCDSTDTELLVNGPDGSASWSFTFTENDDPNKVNYWYSLTGEWSNGGGEQFIDTLSTPVAALSGTYVSPAWTADKAGLTYTVRVKAPAAANADSVPGEFAATLCILDFKYQAPPPTGKNFGKAGADKTIDPKERERENFSTPPGKNR